MKFINLRFINTQSGSYFGKDKKKKPTAEEKPSDKASEDKVSSEDNSGEDRDALLLSTLTSSMEKSNKASKLILIGSSAFLSLIVIGYGVMNYQLSTRISELQESLTITSSSVVDVNTIIQLIFSSHLLDLAVFGGNMVFTKNDQPEYL